MINWIKLIAIIICFVFVPKMGTAHSVDQITFVFDQNERGNYLTVHLTPKGAIDLIVMLKPELEQESIIDLKQYYPDFTTYFNKTVKLKIQEEPISFIFEKGDLISHDATLVFRLVGDVEYQGKVEIEVNSFKEVYRNIKSFVVFNTKAESEKCFLNVENNRCSFSLGQKQKNNASSGSYLWGIGFMILIVILSSVFIMKKNVRNT